jgi:hypothetical protein
MFSVNSSAVDEVGYENGVLAVRFHDNPKTYELPNVPFSLFEAFVNAPRRANSGIVICGVNSSEHAWLQSGRDQNHAVGHGGGSG